MGDDAIIAMKRAAGEAAAKRVESGMIVGLGTGSTAIHAIAHLGERMRGGELRDILAIPTSYQSSVLAAEHGIRLTTVNEVDHIDIAIDGADEVAPDMTLIKGGGAAHTREKIVDGLAREFIVVVDDAKLVDRLGSKYPVPVEVLPEALRPVTRAIEALGGAPELRMAVKKAGPVVTDQGNLVVDARFTSIDDPAELERALNNIPGVLDNGLFVGLADRVLIGALDEASGAPVVSERVRPL
jgi:ribose 5-phosphate isomerase A